MTDRSQPALSTDLGAELGRIERTRSAIVVAFAAVLALSAGLAAGALVMHERFARALAPLAVALLGGAWAVREARGHQPRYVFYERGIERLPRWAGAGLHEVRYTALISVSVIGKATSERVTVTRAGVVEGVAGARGFALITADGHMNVFLPEDASAHTLVTDALGRAFDALERTETGRR